MAAQYVGTGLKYYSSRVHVGIWHTVSYHISPCVAELLRYKRRHHSPPCYPIYR